MNFDLSPEEAQFRDAVRGFARRHLAAGANARARAGAFPFDVARLMAGQGLLGIAFPPAEGGQGGSLMDSILAMEEVAEACPRSADVIQAGNFGPIRTFVEYASAEQKARFLPRLLAGQGVVAVGMTEAEAGSAATELKTACVPDGNGFRLSGAKLFCTNSLEAELFLVYCRFGPGIGGIGSVLVERGAAGFRFGPPQRFMSGEAWRALYFDAVFVPPENVLHGPGGFKKQIAGFNIERLGNAARSLAVGRLAFNLARDHALQRRQFGRPLAEFQGLQWKFADMKLKLDGARLLLYRAVAGASGGLPNEHDTALAKLACNQAGFEAANEAMQILGAMGFGEDTLVDYCMRRARGWMIAGGSVEMMKNRVAEGIFGRAFPQRPPKGPADGP